MTSPVVGDEREPGAIADRQVTPSLRDDAHEFLVGNRAVLLLGLVGALIAHGLSIAVASISIDEELYLFLDSTAGFFDQGRPGLTLFKTILVRTIPLPFFWPIVAVLLMYAVGVGWAFLLSHAMGRALRPIGLLIFLIVFSTIPVQAYYLMWNTTNVEISLGMLCALACAWFAWMWAVEDREPASLGAAIAFGIIAGLTYQSLPFVAMAGVLLLQLVRLLCGPETDAHVRSVRTTIHLLVPGAAAVIVSALVAAATVSQDGHVSSYLRWGTAPVDALVTGLANGIVRYLAGDGFVGGWVLIPTIVVAAIVLVTAIRRGLAGHGWLATLLLAALVLAPFLNSLAVGVIVPNRALQAVPLVAAGLWLIAVEALPPRREVVAGLAVSALALWIWQGGITSRLYLVEATTFEVDRAIASRIAERLVEAGWDGHTIPLVSIGTRSRSPVEDLADHESFGLPFFSEVSDGSRATGFMVALGHDMRYASDEERRAGLERARTMPVWPADGSVVFEDGLGIVKFQENVAPD